MTTRACVPAIVASSSQIDEHGHVFVTWDRGFATEIDPGHTPIHTLAA